MTANPAWTEVITELRTGETAANRPDLVARVFRIKLQVLLDKLLKEHVLGHVIAHTWVVEFQKRGLPHAHTLLIVSPEDKPRTPDDIDARICAELPNPENPHHEELLQVILRSPVARPLWCTEP